MNVLKTLWGLIVDDARLAGILVVGLVIAMITALWLHARTMAALVIWLALILSIAVSVEHQLRLKQAKNRR